MSGSLFGPTSPKGGGAGAGGGAALRTEDEGVLVDAATTLLNFTGLGVQATPIAPGQVRVDVPGTAPGMWAGSVPAVAFAGAPLQASVAFGSPHPSGVNYSVATDEVVVIASGLSLDITIENKTANGFDILLNTAGPLPNLIQVDWQVQPHGVAAGPSGIVSLPGILDYLVVDKGTNVAQDGSQQLPYHSINAALAVAAPGTVVFVHAGIYTEQITPVPGVYLRGVDQWGVILTNPGTGPGDAPIATVGAPVDFTIENMTIRAGLGGGLICQMGVMGLLMKDVRLLGQIDMAGAGSVLELERRCLMTGQVLISGAATSLTVSDSEIVGTVLGGLGVPVVIQDANTVIGIRRSELAGLVGNEAIQWQAANNNVELEWSKVEHGTANTNPFGRTGAETPIYAGHHNRYSLNPEQGGIWANSLPHGQRHESPNEQSFAAANNQAVVADVVGLVFDATVRSVKVHLSVYVDATGDLCEVFELMIARRGAVWLLTSSSTGDSSGLAFTITAAGQVQYTSTNEAGWVSTDLRFVSKVTGV
jgi:hypothetical protein